jgi:hypothetical protein
MTPTRELSLTLAHHFRRPDVDDFLAEMSAEQFNEWRAYYEKYPFGPEWDWFRGGMLLSMVANAFRGKGKPPAKPSDFMPKEDTKKNVKRVPPGRQLFAIAEALGGRVVDLRSPGPGA